MKTRDGVLVLVVLLVAWMAPAQEVIPQRPASPEWGTSDLTLYNLHSFEFVTIDSSTTFTFQDWMKYTTGGYSALVAGVHLPSGALIYAFNVSGCDDDGSLDFLVRLWQCPSLPVLAPCFAPIQKNSSSLSGCGYIVSLGLSLTIDNYASTYFVEFNSLTGTASHRLDHIELWYRLQVSPAPASATFADVPTGHLFFQYVEALAASGITAGCGGGNYCPDQPVTRGQMAVFLSKALGLHWEGG